MPSSKEKQKEYRNRPEVKARKKEYHNEYYSRSEIKERKKKYDLEYSKREYVLEKERKRSIENNKTEKRKEYFKKYRKKEEVRKKIYKKRRERMKSDLPFNIKNKLRKRLSKTIKKYLKTGKVGSSSKYGVNYAKIIENLKPFPKDIENYHVDHVIPLSWFDFNNPKEIRWAFAPENHQWLTIKENLKKGNSYIYIKEL